MNFNGNKAAALAGFIILGLSPSFVDWQEEPSKRVQMITFYAVGVALIYVGLLKN